MGNKCYIYNNESKDKDSLDDDDDDDDNNKKNDKRNNLSLNNVNELINANNNNNNNNNDGKRKTLRISSNVIGYIDLTELKTNKYNYYGSNIPDTKLDHILMDGGDIEKEKVVKQNRSDIVTDDKQDDDVKGHVHHNIHEMDVIPQ